MGRPPRCRLALVDERLAPRIDALSTPRELSPLPVLGTTWQSQIDGGSIGANGMTFVFGFSAPISGIFTAYGEILVDPPSPWLHKV